MSLLLRPNIFSSERILEIYLRDTFRNTLMYEKLISFVYIFVVNSYFFQLTSTERALKN